MKKTVPALILSVVVMLVIAGCGSDPDAIRYGVVTNASGVNGNTTMMEITSGMEGYAQSKDYRSKVYTASANSLEAYTEQFDLAVSEDQIDVIVVDGEEMEIPVYEAQESYHSTRFILFDGMPRKDETSEASIRRNTKVITFSQKDLGYMTGYLLVRDGYRHLGYLTGEETEETTSTWEGFLQGCQEAASDLNLEAGAVTVIQEFSGTNHLTPLRMADALNWYEDGCGIIVTDNEAILPAIVKAAEHYDRKTAAVGFSYSGTSNTVVLSAIPDYEGATRSALQSVEDDTFNGGEVSVFGFAEEAVKIETNFSQHMHTLTETNYTTYLETFYHTTPTDTISENAASDGLVTIDKRSPVSTDAAAGAETYVDEEEADTASVVE